MNEEMTSMEKIDEATLRVARELAKAIVTEMRRQEQQESRNDTPLVINNISQNTVVTVTGDNDNGTYVNTNGRKGSSGQRRVGVNSEPVGISGPTVGTGELADSIGTFCKAAAKLFGGFGLL